MTTIEDRFYQPPEPVYAPLAEWCLFEEDGATIECGAEVDHEDAILCPVHLDQLDQGHITWEEYRALLAHHQL